MLCYNDGVYGGSEEGGKANGIGGICYAVMVGIMVVLKKVV